MFNHSDSMFGVNHKLMKFSKLEQNTIKQIMSLYNGIRCKKEELVKSVKLIMRIVSNIDQKKDSEKLVDSIENIAYDFFDYVYKEYNASRKTNHYMGIQNAQKKWAMPIRNWSLTITQLAQLTIHFDGRLNDALDL